VRADRRAATTRILILDFGSQVTQLIARRVREAQVYCEIHPCDVSDDVRPRLRRRSGIILSGSHSRPTRKPPTRAPQAVFELGVPVLGICYGMQTMAQQLGGRVGGSGHARVRLRRGARARPHPAARRHRGLRSPPRATACSRCG
jgi:GMP synthase (glutamine-hydrolysing)